MKQRLQKLISLAGISSRRKAEILLLEGRVSINGKRALIGESADPELDEIIIDGNTLNLKIATKVILLNKPKGIISSCLDPEGRKTVLSLIPPKLRNGLHPVGRLDQNSRGAIFLTNNGDITLKLTHPKYSHRKIYRVWVMGIPKTSVIRQWRNGIMLDNKKTIPAEVYILKRDQKNSKSLLKIILKEGRNRQIRRVAEILGHPVIDLKRIAIENIHLKNLREGEWRELKEKEWLKFLS